MDHNTWLGSVAEAKVTLEYTKAGWNVFNQITGKAPFDLVVYQESSLRRVQVKGTTEQSPSGSYITQLRSIRSNRTGNKINHLDIFSFDELAVYVEPLDKLFFFWPDELEDKVIITLNPSRLDSFRSEPGHFSLDF